jgi:hypothetical protein
MKGLRPKETYNLNQYLFNIFQKQTRLTNPVQKCLKEDIKTSVLLLNLRIKT